MSEKMLSREKITQLIETAIKDGIEKRWEPRVEDVRADVPDCQLCDAMSLIDPKSKACFPCPMKIKEYVCSKGWNMWSYAAFLPSEKRKKAAIQVLSELKSINVKKAVDVIISAQKEAQDIKK